jgi:hypothetical protein
VAAAESYASFPISQNVMQWLRSYVHIANRHSTSYTARQPNQSQSSKVAFRGQQQGSSLAAQLDRTSALRHLDTFVAAALEVWNSGVQ